jgi:hypothetical protein
MMSKIMQSWRKAAGQQIEFVKDDLILDVLLEHVTPAILVEVTVAHIRLYAAKGKIRIAAVARLGQHAAVDVATGKGEQARNALAIPVHQRHD